MLRRLLFYHSNVACKPCSSHSELCSLTTLSTSNQQAPWENAASPDQKRHYRVLDEQPSCLSTLVHAASAHQAAKVAIPCQLNATRGLYKRLPADGAKPATKRVLQRLELRYLRAFKPTSTLKDSKASELSRSYRVQHIKLVNQPRGRVQSDDLAKIVPFQGPGFVARVNMLKMLYGDYSVIR